MKIAILGSNSQVARSLLPYMLYQDLKLFCRAMDNYKKFGKEQYDMVINCVGVAKPKEMVRLGDKVIGISEKYDLMVLKYLKRFPETLYISLSSGIVVERGIASPYKTAKQYQEIRHRDLFTHNIIDVRLYSFFSKYIDLNAGFLISEMVRCLKKKEVFRCTRDNLVRDYIHPYDLARLILSQKTGNKSIDAYSKKPISLNVLLGIFQERGLKVELAEPVDSPTGKKLEYIPHEKGDFKPRYTSQETVQMELAALL